MCGTRVVHMCREKVENTRVRVAMATAAAPLVAPPYYVNNIPLSHSQLIVREYWHFTAIEYMT